MNKFLKTFIKVVYYVLAIAFGVILVITLPYIVLNNKLTKQMNNHLENGEFVDAMHLIGCYYDSEVAYYYEKDDIQLVLFRATPFVDTVYETKDEQGNDISVTAQETLKLGYFGFLCNVKNSYDVDSSYEADSYENKTTLLVNDNTKINILDYDNSQDGKIDSILTLINGSYVIFTISNEDVDEINKLNFIDREGKSFLSVNMKDNPLSFEHSFFVEFQKFVPRYNELVKSNVLSSATEEEMLKEQNELEQIATQIIEKNPGFTVGKYDNAIKDAQFSSYLFSILYFLGVLIVGDLLVGKKITVKIIKVIFRPVINLFPKKKKTEDNSQELYDYYSQVIINIENTNGLEQIVNVTLSRNESNEIFELTKENGYLAKRRIHAGIYEKIEVTCDGYKVLNLPETLEVKGFKTELKLEIEKEQEL